MRFLIMALATLGCVNFAEAQSVAGCHSAVNQARACCAHPENCLSGDAQKLYDAAKKDDQKALRESDELQTVFTKKCEEHIRDCHNRCEGVTRTDVSSLLKQCEGFSDLVMQTRPGRVPAQASDVTEKQVPDEAQPDPIH